MRLVLCSLAMTALCASGALAAEADVEGQAGTALDSGAELSVTSSSGPTGAGPAAVLYGVTGDGGSPAERLFILSTTDATSTQVMALGNGNDGEEIAFNRDDGLMYHASGGIPAMGEGDIIFEKINLDTLQITEITLSGYEYREVAGLTYAGSGVFLASDRNGPVGLSTITTGGVVANLGPTEVAQLGLAFIGSTLYGVARNDALLRTLDPATGDTLASVVMTLSGFNIVGATGLATNPDDNTLWALLRLDSGFPGERALATVDRITGVATMIGITDVEGMAGIAFAYEPCATCEVTPSVGTGPGTITPSTVQNVPYGNTAMFTLTPGVGHHSDFVDGTCGGTLVGDTFTTSTIWNHCTVVAHFAINTYTLEYTPGANGSITGNTSQTVNYGGNGTQVTAVPDANHHFVDWSDGVMTASRTDTNVMADLNVTANFAIDTFTLTYTAGPNGSISGDTPQVVEYSQDGTEVTAVPDANHHFVSWSDGVMTASRTDTNVMADLSVTANFAIDTHTVTSSVGTPAGSINPLGPQEVDHGDTRQFTLTPDANYHIDSVGGTCGGMLVGSTFTTNAITTDCTVIANFAIDTHTVTPSVGTPAGSISPSNPQEIDHGQTTQFTLTPDANYHIDSVGGTCGGSLEGSTYTTNAITADCTVIANFAIDTHTVTSSVGAPAGDITPLGPQEIDHGETTQFTLTPDANYHIDSVGGTCGGSLGGNTYTTNAITADCTVVANFAIDTFTLTYMAGPNGSITGDSPQTVEFGQDGTEVTAVPDANYHFVSWSDGVMTASRTDTNVMADLSVTANFAIDTHTVTSSVGAPAGDITPLGPQEIDHGDTTQFTLTPDANYHIESVGGTCGGMLVGSTFTTNAITADCTVIANFAIDTHTVTSSVGTPSGTIAPLGPQEIDHGATTQFTLTPDTNYQIDSVGGTCGGSLEGSTYTTSAITADCTVIANFAIDTHTVTSSVGTPAGSIAPLGPQEVDHGDTTQFTLTPDSNYHIDSVGGTCGGMLVGSTFTTNAITTDCTVIANFAIDTHTVTSSVGTPAGSIAPLGPQEIDHGATTQFTLTPDAGHHIDSVGGTCGGMLVGSTYTTNAITTDCTVVANFAIDTFTLTYTPSANGSITGDTMQTVNYGEDGTEVTAVPDINHNFVSWSDGVMTASRTDTNVMADLSVIANFTADNYTVTSSVGTPSGSISPLGDQQVDHGQTTQFTLTPDTNYHIDSVGGTCGGSLDGNTFTTAPITAICTVIANFAIDTRTVTSSVGTPSGSIDPLGPQEIDLGATTQFTLTPAVGHHIDSVGGTCGGTLDGVTYTTNAIMADCTVVANFAIDTFTLTYTPGPNGSITGDTSQTVNYGEDGTEVTAVPDINHNFVSWSDGVMTASRTDTNVMADLSVTANFSADNYTVSSSVGTPAGSISPMGDQQVDHGQTTQFTLTPDPNYHIDSVGGTCGGMLDGNTYTTNAITANCTVIANFAIDTHTVTSSVGTPAGSIDPLGPQEVEHGETTQFTLTPDVGHHIDSVGGTCGGTLDGDTFTTASITADCTVVANFAIDTFTLTYTPGPNGSITGDTSQTVDYGQDGTEVTAVPDANYNFVSWSDGVMTASRTDTNVMADLSVTANFAIGTFTVTSSVGTPSGSINPLGAQQVGDGDTTQFTLTPDANYHIDSVGGTCGGSLLGNTYTTNAITADCTVIANFAIDTHTVTSSVGTPSGSIAPLGPQEVDHGETTQFTLTPDSNYHIDSVGGTCGGSLEGSTYTTNAITADCTVIANFAIDTHTVTSSVGTPAGNISPLGPQEVDHGETTQFTLTPDANYHIDSVGGTCGGSLEGSTYTTSAITAECTVVANFAIDTFTLSYTPGPNGSITGETSQTVDYGEDGTEVTAVPDANYHFVDWTDGVLTASRTDTNVMADLSVTANFAIDTHTVTSSVGTPAGSIDPLGPQEVDHGETTQFTLTPDANYHIDSVGGTCGGTLEGDTFTTDAITTDCTVIANFAIDTHTVTSSVGTPAGDITPLGPQEVDHGETAQFTLTPDANYHIDSVGGTCGGTLDGTTFTTNEVTADCTVIANFAIDTHTVTSSVGTPAGSIAPLGPQEVDHGSTTQFTLAPDANYHIDSVGGTCGGTLEGDTFTTVSITGDCTVIANFAIDTFTLTYTPGPNGSITGDTSQTVDYGEDGTEVTAVPDANYQFVAWSDGVMTASRTDTNVMADLSVTANFAIDTHIVTSSVGTGSGSISPLGEQEVDHGQTAQFTLTPGSGQFIQSVGGTCGGHLVGNTYTTNPVTADCTVIANFSTDPDVIVIDGFE